MLDIQILDWKKKKVFTLFEIEIVSRPPSQNNLLPGFQEQILVQKNNQVEVSNQQAGKRLSISYLPILPYGAYQREKAAC